MRPFILALVLSLLIHIFVGWEWAILAAIMLGYLVSKRAWLWGGVLGLSSWAILLLYSFIVAPAAMARMNDTVASMLGGMPAWLVSVVTLLLGVVVGLLGASIGSAAASIFRKPPTRSAASTDIPPVNFQS